MIDNNSTFLSFFQNLSKRFKKIIKLIKKTGRKNRLTFQRFQITSLYFCAVIVLMYTVKNSLGFFPEMLFDFFPFLAPVFDWPILKILATPEKTFVLYLLILELIINRSVFGFSILVKYNVLLIFILEMVQNLLASYWDILFIRELATYTGGLPIIARDVTLLFFVFLFVIFLGLYMIAFYQSFCGRIPSFPGVLRCITDSVAFWLQLKPKDKDKKE